MAEKVVASRDKQTVLLDHDLSAIMPLSSRRLKGMTRLGVTTLRDLVNFYPFRYNDFSQVVPITGAVLGTQATILGTIKEVRIKRPRKRLFILEALVSDDTGVVVVTWFNQPWMQKSIVKDARIIIKGTIEHNYGFYRMSSPLHTILSDEDKAGGIMPVYHANSDITAGWVIHAIADAFAKLPALLDPLPVNLRNEHGLMSRHAALKAIHNPANDKERREARVRLAFEEILIFQLYMQQKRRNQDKILTPTLHVTDGKALNALRVSLPFTLTADQDRSVAEILNDMASPVVMNRLLLGDVGSGKTIVAALALAASSDGGHQAVMMAPTEVLAEQYAKKIGSLFDAIGIPWALLTSSTKPKDRSSLLESLATGNIAVLFGTHALIEADVVFSDLALAIIDEQHRFGVNQRHALLQKGSGVDFLSMTATPIPRSLALTIYGDMDTSYIRSKPQVDTITTTKIINRKDIRFAYDAIREAIKHGEQAYIVCPLISSPDASGATAVSKAKSDIDEIAEDDDTPIELLTEFSQDQDGDHIKAAEQEVRYLQNIVFPERNIALMTSKLKSTDKRRVMDEFRTGNVDVLVSTTVVEVGIDVENATVMVIQDADRFGLSQLHQLRGRVGRGKKNGAVFLVTGTQNEESLKRLKAMEKSSDGFKLAEYDLALRREGDILGSRQHGEAILRLVNVINDAELIERAHKVASKMLDDDPNLCALDNQHLGYELEILFSAYENITESASNPNTRSS